MPTDNERVQAQIDAVVVEMEKRDRTIAFLDGVLTVLYPFCVMATFIAFVSNLADGRYGVALLSAVITALWVWLTIQFFKDN